MGAQYRPSRVHPVGGVSRRFIITESEVDLTSHAGLGLIGVTLHERTHLAADAAGVSALRSDAMSDADILSCREYRRAPDAFWDLQVPKMTPLSDSRWAPLHSAPRSRYQYGAPCGAPRPLRKRLDGVSYGFCMLPPWLRDLRPFAAAATRPHLRVPMRWSPPTSLNRRRRCQDGRVHQPSRRKRGRLRARLSRSGWIWQRTPSMASAVTHTFTRSSASRSGASLGRSASG